VDEIGKFLKSRENLGVLLGQNIDVRLVEVLEHYFLAVFVHFMDCLQDGPYPEPCDLLQSHDGLLNHLDFLNRLLVFPIFDDFSEMIIS